MATHIIRAAEEAVAEWHDALELWLEDQDQDAADNLIEVTRYLFDDTPALGLYVVLAKEES
jgi:hypothetical protein